MKGRLGTEIEIILEEIRTTQVKRRMTFLQYSPLEFAFFVLNVRIGLYNLNYLFYNIGSKRSKYSSKFSHAAHFLFT